MIIAYPDFHDLGRFVWINPRFIVSAEEVLPPYDGAKTELRSFIFLGEHRQYYYISIPVEDLVCYIK